MIVCICQNISSRDLRERLARGLSIEEVSQELGLGTGCGACLEYACQMLAEAAPRPRAKATQAA